MGYTEHNTSVGELIRKQEDNYIRGGVNISEYVLFDMYDTINTIEAYLNSKHTSGQFDSLGREKPFFNIVIAASNIWFRATDIDRKNIRIKATKYKDTINAFLATVHIQRWMREVNFGQFLNDWGRVLARYGSASCKFVEKDGQLIPSVTPWNRLISDPIDYDNNVKIEIMEVTEAQLRKNLNYDQNVVESLCDARRVRETIKRKKKDNKSDYIKLYEIHGELPLSYITKKESDEDVFQQQMAVICYEASDGKNKFDDYILYAGREAKEPNMITHLIEEDGRTLSIGAVEHLFQSQWMENQNKKAMKDHLDLASKIIFQTADESFLETNALNSIENGDVLVHALGKPLTQVANNAQNFSALQAFGQEWKVLGNEIAGISESMLGQAAPSGTAWRQVDALLQESHSLFELMTENKGLYLEKMFREYIIPFIKKKMNHSKEIAHDLEANDIDFIDAKYIKATAVKESNRIMKEKVLKGEMPTPQDQQALTDSLHTGMKQAMNETGNQRFFKPSEISDKTWKEQFDGMEWDLEVDVTGEGYDYKEALATMNTALQVIMNPAYDQNPQAKMVVTKILSKSGYFSPLELSQVKSSPLPAAPPASSTVGNPLSKVNTPQ